MREMWSAGWPRHLKRAGLFRAYAAMVGLKLHRALPCTDPRIFPLCEICARHRMPVLCHTWQKVMGDHPDESTPMQLAEVAGQFPHTIFVCRHSGGDYEYGAKAMRGLDNVFMDVGGGEAHGGFLLPVRCIVALVQQAIAAGAEIHGREAVTSWHSEGQGVRVTTTRATYRADRLIPTADPCLNSLLHDWQLPLAVERQVVG